MESFGPKNKRKIKEKIKDERDISFTYIQCLGKKISLLSLLFLREINFENLNFY